ncbi:hypothetical protein [Candidatus Manganitrophus noduliformans]|uniref:Uncharacterized protein n=1 Tax=Candidatus Manganitrophus noduliformans TaxID=2606439 RepID=A0A7X6DMB1_9BACT|nr:hypothetical protein [Candidatus Manganitrophus noduliformans]NKE69853.1 hypothetical protein [Candidatus Manganitrophus noduliformans]
METEKTSLRKRKAARLEALLKDIIEYLETNPHMVLALHGELEEAHRVLIPEEKEMIVMLLMFRKHLNRANKK